MANNFFLYGIYGEGQSCHYRFKNLIEDSQTAFVKGTLNRLVCGLPVLIPQGQDMIPGQLVQLKMTDSHWPILDALNGYDPSNLKKSLMVRESLEVFLPEQGSQMAQTYCINQEKLSQVRPLTTHEVPLVLQKPQSLVDQLTERQRTYLQKLSQAKGREIIPVDMGLYRELMSLELIVDKGRRIALTRLGTEISHFL